MSGIGKAVRWTGRNQKTISKFCDGATVMTYASRRIMVVLPDGVVALVKLGEWLVKMQDHTYEVRADLKGAPR